MSRAFRAAALPALLLAGLAGGCGSNSSSGGAAASSDTSTHLPPGLAGRPAPRMRLADARGGRLDTATLRGKPYAVTFLYTRCPDVCPLIGSEVSSALRSLGPAAKKTAVIGVTVDPSHDNAGAVTSWLKRHDAPSQFHYLIGSEAALKPVWKAWYAAPQVPGDPRSAHTATIWFVDAKGRLAAKLDAGGPVKPSAIAALLKDPAA
jgi:protein SCO1/2